MGIATIIPTMQSVALVSHNLGVVKKKKVSTKDILGLGVTNIVGASLIQTTAGFTSGL